ncbi:hypothetical protein [Microvirga terricola]|uniref:Pectate lyase superfamily protein n=1 Tax=Microvirga terricola TaxID=2719797 RepID=A0ABX0VAM7_9HYPH|nr:hypothetical protein [Microvirga terricola]NIX76900.1 hypothetical protein [Microvirga terricola]
MTINSSEVINTVPEVGAIPRPLDLKLREILCFDDFGPDKTGVASVSTAWQNFMNALRAGPCKHGYIPQGIYRFSSQPADIDFPVVLEGDGLNATSFIRDYNGTSGKGLLSFTAGSNGSTLRGIGVASEVGTSSGALISIKSTATSAVGSITLEDLYLTTRGSDTHETTLYVDGTAKATPATGCRVLSLRNVAVFGSSGYSVVLKGVQGLTWTGGGIYPAGGTGAASGGLQISGTSTVKSVNIRIAAEAVNYINLTQAQTCHLAFNSIGATSGVSLDNDGTASTTMLQASYIGGLVRNNWVNSGVYRPTGWSAT